MCDGNAKSLITTWFLADSTKYLYEWIEQNSLSADEAFMLCWTQFTSTLVSAKAVGIANKQWLWVVTWQTYDDWLAEGGDQTSWPFF